MSTTNHFKQLIEPQILTNRLNMLIHEYPLELSIIIVVFFVIVILVYMLSHHVSRFFSRNHLDIPDDRKTNNINSSYIDFNTSSNVFPNIYASTKLLKLENSTFV